MEVAFKKGFVVNSTKNKTRLDIILSKKFPEYSRSFFKNLISNSKVYVNGKIETKAGRLLLENDEVEFLIESILDKDQPKNISNLDVQVIFEHPDFLIINKGPGVIVHAVNKKDAQPTLVDWLISKFKEITQIGSPERPGIVHRLDKDTSGLMIIPRTNLAHKIFGDMFKNREIKKSYLAVVKGHPEKSGTIDFNIVRHPVLKNKMTHVPKKDINLNKYANARDALTEFKVVKYFNNYTLVEAFPKTGRTHQIRVHFAAIGHPLVGDTLYGEKSKDINRHALHAFKLEFTYNGKNYLFKKELPNDINKLISIQ